MTTTLQPLQEAKRDVSLDILRGFALAGVLFMFCVNDIGTTPGYTYTLPDQIINWPKYILVENRMYTMLILIFGIGFHVQLEKAKQKGASLVPSFMRRLIGLLVIGFIHAIFLSHRDILMFYALAGVALIMIRNSSNMQLFVLLLVLFLLLVTPVIEILFGNQLIKARALTQPNNYRDHVQYNWQFFKFYHQTYTIYVDMLFHFLLGFWIARTGLLQKIKSDRKFRRKLFMATLILSLLLIPFYYFWVDEYLTGLIPKIKIWQKFLIAMGMRTVWQIWMMVSVTLYGTILIGLSVNSGNKSRFRPLAAFGQMALSNYLIQSIILVPYFLAFDKYNNMPPFTGFILFLLFLALQLVFSTWWMARYKLGPFEWLLRSITYWKWQPMKKSTTMVQNIPAMQNA